MVMYNSYIRGETIIKRTNIFFILLTAIKDKGERIKDQSLFRQQNFHN